MEKIIKNCLLITCLVLVIAVLCLFTYKVAVTDPESQEPAVEMEAIVQEHVQHTHEHAGLACCPCGLCHKHEEDEETAIVDPPLWIRLLALGTFMTVMMSAIVGMFWG